MMLSAQISCLTVATLARYGTSLEPRHPAELSGVVCNGYAVFVQGMGGDHQVHPADERSGAI